MSKPLLTIGMAHFNEFSRAAMTIESIRINNWSIRNQLQFVVVDQSPANSPSSGMLKNLVNSVKGKYVYFPEPLGTSPPRNEIFNHVDSDYVLVLDCHVLLHPQAIQRLIDFYGSNPDTKDLHQGPFLTDSMDNTVGTHYTNQWGAEMWGRWANVWKSPEGQIFEMAHIGGYARPITVSMRPELLSGLRDIPWAGHEQKLLDMGYSLPGMDIEHPPIEIPGQGLGNFTCRKDAWLGFNKDANGFGGEELYIHEKFRQAGRKCWLLPFLQVWHCFGRENGIQYPLTREKKQRNYILESLEIGQPPMEDIRRHFTEEIDNPTSKETFDMILADPINALNYQDAMFKAQATENKKAGCSACQKAAQNKPDPAPAQMSPSQIYEMAKLTPRDLDQHMDTLRRFGDKSSVVFEISERQESTIAFAVSKAEKVVSIQYEQTPQLSALKLYNQGRMETHRPGDQVSVPKDVDLFYYDHSQTYASLHGTLKTFVKHCRKYIIIHDTVWYSNSGVDGSSPGLVKAMYDFMDEFPEWTVLEHHSNQFGLTVLTRVSEDRPTASGVIKKGLNWAKAQSRHALAGFPKLPLPVYQERREACWLCPSRTINGSGESACSICLCPLEPDDTRPPGITALGKMMTPTESCPLPQPKWGPHK